MSAPIRANNRARLLARAVALSLAVCFAWANMACAATGALERGHDQEQSSHHHSDSDSDKGHSHDDGLPNCCSDLVSIVSSTTQTDVKPSDEGLPLIFALALTVQSEFIAPLAEFTYDHGPPGVTPPEFLSAESLSPRAPPRGV